MRAHRSKLMREYPLRRLVAGLAVALASGGSLAASATVAGDRLEQPAAPTNTFVVKNCDDAGADSLREAVQSANQLGGDATIQFDPNVMGCSTITLTTGEIDITVGHLTIEGPDPDVVTIDGGISASHLNRIFKQTAPSGSSLHLDHLELMDAKYMTSGNQPAHGGCVLSTGTVYLTHTRLDNCSVVSESAPAEGGAIWAFAVNMVDSTVTHSKAASQLSQSAGGGIFADSGGLQSLNSTISGNLAVSYAPSPNAVGGGASIRGPSTFERSTISENQALFGAGLIVSFPTSIANSTIVNNIATQGNGALEIHGALTLYNSTVVLNEAHEYGRIAGINADSIEAVSSLIARNMTISGAAAVESDIKSADGQVTGSSNFIMAAAAGTMLPMDTHNGCPRLAPLLDNGGPTLTVGLLPASPAIDIGDDPFTLGTDQRGVGFDRVVGTHADIGAYEWSTDNGDEINRSEFESCE